MSSVTLCAVPADCRLAATLHDADFADCYLLPDPMPEASALQCWLRFAGRTPGWMNGLMRLRNRSVALVGLKNLGDMAPHEVAKPADDYRPGDRVGIFTLQHSEPDEVVLGDHDKHLRVSLSLRKQVVDGRPADAGVKHRRA